MPVERSNTASRGRSGASHAGGSHAGGSRVGNRGRNRGGNGGRNRGRGRRGGRGGSNYTPYEAPNIPAGKSLNFDGGYHNNDITNWDESKLETPGIEKIHFGANFPVKDEHLACISSRPALATSLKFLSLGDSDTGNGYHVSDAAVIALASACPNLRVLMLDAVTSVSDAALLACVQACHYLERLRITGNDKVKGKVKGASLEQLKASPDLAPNLKELVLYDQDQYSKKFEKAIKALTWVGGKLVRYETDGGMFGPGAHDLFEMGFGYDMGF
ncbi:hypothetical protein FPV67DRAFT_1470004 [Lyophyllum atratum]|nr:hypothetical protein FPV67DRAFT_1470004 [Lyophyllum atratum]